MRSLCTARRAFVVLVLLLVGVPAGWAQPSAETTPFCREPDRRRTLDAHGLGAVYCATHPALVRPLRGAHASARPIFYGAVPLAWGAALVRGGDYADAYRLTLSQVGTYGLVLGLKHAAGRPRPYVRRALHSRSARYGPSKGEKYQSFPSGHAALSAALATSWGLSYPRWYVIGPGAVWAVGVSLSRLHLGVHYPSDVLVGAALGAGVAALIHQVRGHVTPPALRDEPARSVAPPMGIRLRF